MVSSKKIVKHLLEMNLVKRINDDTGYTDRTSLKKLINILITGSEPVCNKGLQLLPAPAPQSGAGRGKVTVGW